MKDGRYQILHVEDKTSQFENCRYAINGALSSKGKRADIIQAKDLSEASRQILSRQREIDLIILDIILESTDKENGLELVEQVYDINPSIPIYILSTNITYYKTSLDDMISSQKIRGYGDPTNNPWTDEILHIIESKLVSILHLSDIHHGKFFAFDRLVKNRNTILKSLCDQVENADLVVVSGDLSSVTKKEEFDEAKVFLDTIKTLLGINNSSFVFAPGNHDRDRSCTDTHLFSQYLQFINDFYSVDMDTDCIIDYPPIGIQDEYTISQSILDNMISIYAYPSRRTIVVSMNSVNPRYTIENLEKKCFASDNPNDGCGLLSGGEISSEQLNNVKLKLNELFTDHPETKNYARIATFHHNIFEPAHIERYEWCPTILNEGNLMKFLSDNDFHFVLHGHLHHAENYLFCIGNNNAGISVISTGTLSATDRELSNSFSANKISFFVDLRGNISDAKLTRYTIRNDDYQWVPEIIPIHFLEV